MRYLEGGRDRNGAPNFFDSTSCWMLQDQDPGSGSRINIQDSGSTSRIRTRIKIQDPGSESRIQDHNPGSRSWLAAGGLVGWLGGLCFNIVLEMKLQNAVEMGLQQFIDLWLLGFPKGKTFDNILFYERYS